ncbi:MAG TPA: AMP-binding protein, partial [Burkholderiaceae bacterium]|nr:AMP-binding protein [Burkholderiaceae bacterium]
MNLFSLLDETARRFGDRGAVFDGVAQVATFSALRERALRLAGALASRHRPGSRIAVYSENRAEYPELLFAAWAAGLAVVPLNFKLHPREVVAILADAGAAAVFASPQLAGPLAVELQAATARGNAAPGPNSSTSDVALQPIGDAEYQALLEQPPIVPAEVEPAALAWLFYTSGTTGRSKGAMLSHRNLFAMTIAHLADVESLDEHASLIHAAPMSHGSGVYLLPYVARGARQVIPASGGFDPDEFIELASHHPGCGAFLAPTMVHRLTGAAERSGRRPSRLRSIVYGGGPMYVEQLKKAIAVFGQVFTQIYGQGEAPMTITWLRRRDHESADDAILGSVGWARSGVQVAVVDGGGQRVADGEIGEVVCRGAVVMSGYWNNPQASAQA